MNLTIRKNPCKYCPYRKDVPSGVWAPEEYAKLKLYDAPTGEQPPAVFKCHEQSGQLCCGWAQVHTTRGNAFDLLALRFCALGGYVDMPTISVPLFKSGTEAAEHGMRDIKRPKALARRAMRYLMQLKMLKRKR